MKIQNARQELCNILSFFSESFSRPSFKIFSSFIISFIQLGKEPHTSSMVQSLTQSFLHRSLSSFTRFLGENLWTVEEVQRLLCVNSSGHWGSPPGMSSFLSWMTLLLKRRARRWSAVVGIRIIPKTWPMSLAISGSSWLCSTKSFFCPCGPASIIRKGREGAAPFKPNSLWLKRSSEPWPCQSLVNSMSWPIAGTGLKPWLRSAERLWVTA